MSCTQELRGRSSQGGAAASTDCWDGERGSKSQQQERHPKGEPEDEGKYLGICILAGMMLCRHWVSKDGAGQGRVQSSEENFLLKLSPQGSQFNQCPGALHRREGALRLLSPTCRVWCRLQRRK